MRLYVCMNCGHEWESGIECFGCPKCKVGNIFYEEETDDNKDNGTQEDAKREGQTICSNDVCK